LVRAHAW